MVREEIKKYLETLSKEELQQLCIKMIYDQMLMVTNISNELATLYRIGKGGNNVPKKEEKDLFTTS